VVTPELIRGVLLWQSGMSIDGDGSPRCYHPDSSRGLDRLANAGGGGTWWGIVCNDQDQPIVQGPNDPAPGYFVSATALVDSSRPTHDPARYVDSETVPYVVISQSFLPRYAVRLGDVAMVIYQTREVGAVVADIGPRNHYGEGSIALADALGIPSSPRAGGVRQGVTFLIFQGSSRGWPREVAEIQAQARDLFDSWGGRAAVPWLRPIV
jgi:hypothetical protein